ncbi:VCBS domain-containing protein [Vibrio barjaei]|uniref:VCBS domain-containing protein n=1 Tax=Vibrio barjaei TaxID=1676683 RepID=A0ABW7II73_9VIBR
MTDKKSDKAKTKSGQSIKETLPQKTVSRKNQRKNEKKRRLFSTLRYQVGLPPALTFILPSLATRHASAQGSENLSSPTNHPTTEAMRRDESSGTNTQHIGTSSQESVLVNADTNEARSSHIAPSARLELHHYKVHAYTNPHLLATNKISLSSEPTPSPRSSSTGFQDHLDQSSSQPNAPQFIKPEITNQLLQVKEDGQLVHGQLIATDKNTNETLSFATNTQVDGLTLNPDGTYTFDPTDTVYQSLKEGEIKELTVPVTVTDSVGLTSHAYFVIQVTGTNDIPSVKGQVSGHIQEDINVDSSGLLTVAGQVHVHDIDHGESHTLAEVIKGQFGTLTIDDQGHWRYQVDNSLNAIQQLTSKQQITETISIHTADHTSQNIQVVIGGSDDNAVISGIDSGAVVEDLHVKNGSIKTQGDLTIVDTDLGEAHFVSQVLVGQFGSLNIDANGHWSYEANNLQAAIQQLGKGDELHETFTVASVDGTTHEIKIEIDGVNDLPVMAGQSQSVKEDGAVFHGQIVATDVDHDLLTYSISNPIDGLSFSPDGSYAFDPSHASYQHLAVGDTYTVKTTVIVTDTAGGQDHKELSFVIEGTNDKPTVSPITAQFHEDQSQHLDINLLSHAQDADGDALSVGNLFQVKMNGHIDRLPDGFGIVNGHLQVDPSSSTFQHLAQGEIATFELSYKVTDSHGASTPQSVTVKIVGTDDKAQLASSSINIGEAAAEHTYHGTSIKGSLQLTDIDTHDNPQFVDMIYQSSSRLGTLALRADGHYEYFLYGNYIGTANAQKTVAALKPGESIIETFNVKTADGQTKPVTVTIHGEEDSAQIVVNYGTTDNHLHEDSMTSPAYPTELFSTGIVKVIDPDHDDDQLKPQTLVSTHGGHFTVTETGMWQYHIDNSLPVIQQLGKGESFQEQFTVESKDGSAQKVITVTVHGTNDNPEVSSTVTLPSGNEDKPYIISSAALLANASDVDANDAGHLSVASLVALKADGSSAGTITDNHNGSFTFTPEQNYNGQVHFNYEVHDGHGGSIATSASSVLKPVSDNAQISYASTDHHLAGVTEDRGYIDTHDELHFEGKLDIVDPDQGEAEFDINYGPQTYNGIGYDTKLGGHILLMRDGHYTYTIRDHQPQVQSLNQGEVLTDQCVVRAKDGTTFTIEVSIHGTNDVPTLSAQTQSVTEDGHSLNGQMQGRDIDHGATLTYSIAHAIDGLTFNADGSYSFDPSHASYQQLKDGEHKSIDIPVTVTDEHGASSTQNLTINLKGTGDAAVIGGVDTGDVHENQAGQNKSPDYAHPGIGVIGQDALTTTGRLTISDADTGDSVFDPNGGTFSYSGKYGHLLLFSDGRWSYGVAAGTHDWYRGSVRTNVGSTIDQLGQGETLTDTITVHSKDGTTHDIVITIHGDNDAPYVSSQVALQSGKEDISQSFTKAELLANAIDVDNNDAGLITVANLLADHGSIRDNHDGTYTYTPELNYHGKVHFSYDINDAHGGSTPTGASFDLVSVNDASELVAGQDLGTVTEDHLRSGTSGQLWSGWTNLDVTDVDGASEAEIAFIEVNGIKHAVPADFAMSLNANHGYFSTTHSTDGHNKWSYTADNASPEIQGLKTGQQLQDTMVIITKDGTRIPVTATVQGQDDHVIIDTPDALTAAIGTVVEDIKTTVVGMLQAHDLDKGDQVTFELAGSASSQAGSYGTFYVDRAGHWHYDLDAAKVDSLRSGDGKAEVFNIVAISSDGSRATQKVEVLVRGTDDAATITGQSTGSVTEDLHVQGDARHTVFTGGVLNAVDPDAGQSGFQQTLKAHAVSDPYGGSLSIGKAGGWTYSVPNANLQHLAQGETEHVQYQVRTLGGDTHVITVDIVGTNDKPTLTAQTQTVNEDGSLLNGKMQGSDIDHVATLTYSIAKSVDGLTFNADGSYTFDPTNANYEHLAQGQTQTLTIPVTVTDEHGANATQNLTITVTGTNDAAHITGVDSGDVYESTYADRSPDYQRGNISHLWNDHIHTSGKLDIVDSDAGEAHFDNNAPAYQYFGQYGRLILQTDGNWSYYADVGNSAVGRKIDALNTGENLTDTITIRSADGTTHDVVITLHGDNDAPFASGEVQLNSGREDQVQTITQAQLLANSMDVDSSDAGKLHVDNLNVDHGSIRDNQDGTFTFTPDSNYNGTVKFSYDVTDNHGASTHTSASMTLAAVEDKTEFIGANHGIASEDVRTPMSNHVSLLDAVDWQALQITDVDSPNTQVTVEFSGHQYTWDLGTDLDVTTPYGKFQFHTITSGPHQGEHSWNYIGDNKNSDVQGLKAGESIQETIKLIAKDGTEFPIHVEVKGTEDGVVIDSTSELGHVIENAQTGASVSGQLNAHDTDIHDQVHWTATPSSGVSGSYGTFHVDTAGQWHYDVDQGKATQLGTGDEKWEYFNVEAVSSDGSQVTKRVAVVVHGHNDNPTVTSDVSLAASKEDKVINLTQADLLAHASNVDTNDRGWLRVTNLTADHGHITTNQDGSFTFTPDTNYNGIVRFNYDVTDRHGGSTPAQASVSLQAVNDLPSVHGDSSGMVTEAGIDAHGATVGSASVQGTLTATDPDSGDTVAWHVTQQSGTYGRLTVDQHGQWHYQLNDASAPVQQLVQGATAQDTFVVTATDKSGTPVSQTVTIDVHGSNDGASIDGHTTSSLSLDLTEDSTTSTLNGHLQLTDVDSGENQFAPLTKAAGTYGHLDLDANGDWTYTLDNQLAATNGLHTGQVVTDHFVIQSPDGTASKSITVNVHGHDDLPTLTVNEGEAVNSLDLFAGIQGQGVSGLQYSTDGIHYSSTPPEGFVLDADGHTLHVDVSGTGYDHLATGVKQSIYINYQLQEGTGVNQQSVLQHGLVEVIGTSDAPVLHQFSPRANQFSGPVRGNLLTGATDVDDGAHLVLTDIQYKEGGGYHTLLPGQSHDIAGVGTIHIEANGDYVFTPDSTFTGNVPSMWYRVTDTTDSQSVEKQSTLNISIDPNHQPTVSVLSASFNEDADLAISMRDFGYADSDSDPLHWITITQVPDASHGHLIVDGRVVVNGNLIPANMLDRLIFRPVTNYNGSATFSYKAHDGHSYSTEQHAQLSITPVNDVPTIHLTPVTPVKGTVTQTDVDIGDTHQFGVASPAGQFGTLSVDQATGAYQYVPNGHITGMNYNQQTGHYLGHDTFEVSVTDNAGATSSLFVTFGVEGIVTAPAISGLAPTVSTQVTTNPTVANTAPQVALALHQGASRVSIDLTSTSDSGSSNSDDLTNIQAPEIGGHTDIPFSLVKLYDGNKVIGSGYSDGQGDYQIVVTTLANGAHNLRALALGPASALPATSSMLPITIDTQAPTPVVTVDTITRDNVLNATESQSMITISGDASGGAHPGDIVTIEVGGHSYSGKLDAAGHYNIDVPGSELEQVSKVKVSVTAIDDAGNSATTSIDHHYDVDKSVGSPTISFESPGSDNLYSKAEIAQGAAGTITATVHAAADAKVGEHLNINGVDHVLDAYSLKHGINLEVTPSTPVRAVMTDEHGNVNSALNVAAGTKPEPIVVTAPSGSHQISTSLGTPTLMPTGQSVAPAQQGWRILVNGHYQTSFNGKWGTLTIDPQTGHLSYHDHGTIHTGPHGSPTDLGVHQEHFEIALQGSLQDDITLHVKVSILNHGPGHSGKLTEGAEVLDMTVTPLLHHNPPPPPPPPLAAQTSADEPMTSQDDVSFDSITIMSELGITKHMVDDSQHHTRSPSVNSYMDKLGIHDAQEHSDTSEQHALPDDIDVVLNDAEHISEPLKPHVDEHNAELHQNDESDSIHHREDIEHHHNDDPTLPDDLSN